MPVPDCKGNYSPIAGYNGKAYYTLDGNGYTLWWDGVDSWIISEVLGVLGDYGWAHVNTDIEGDYTEYGTATEPCTVSEIV